jgi:hypothetical protein
VLAGKSVPEIDFDLLKVPKEKKFLGIFKRRS